MQYNTIHNRWDLGLGLHFSLEWDHPEHLGKWLCKSNIPLISFKALKALTKDDAVKEVQELLKNNQINTHFE